MGTQYPGQEKLAAGARPIFATLIPNLLATSADTLRLPSRGAIARAHAEHEKKPHIRRGILGFSDMHDVEPAFHDLGNPQRVRECLDAKLWEIDCMNNDL